VALEQTSTDVHVERDGYVVDDDLQPLFEDVRLLRLLQAHDE
jgi:hypothetical protein